MTFDTPVLSINVTRMLLCFGLALLSGCAQLDDFSQRATAFNAEVADAQNRTMLLNILRSAHRYPMHFTELSTLSGTETLQSTAGLALPFSQLNGGSGVRTFSPSITLSQSPTFNVAVLETQEFYRGMMSPVDHELMLSYVNQGVAPEMIYTLLFSSIIYRSNATGTPITIANNFHKLKDELRTDALCNSKDSEFLCFQDVLRALLFRGLSIEATSDTNNLGPLLDETSFKDPKGLTELLSAGLEVESVTLQHCQAEDNLCPEGLSALSADKRDVLTKGSTLYRVRKKSAGYRFCFNEEPGHKPPTTDRPDSMSQLARDIRTLNLDAKLACRSRVSDQDRFARDKLRAQEVRNKAEATRDDLPNSFTIGTFSLEVRPRSTEGLVYYLGEIARCDLQLDQGPHCAATPKIQIAYRGGGAEDTLFKLSPSDKVDNDISAEWHGKYFGLRMDPTGQDRSGQVLRILTQLLALNRSAKDFPTPTVVPLLTR